MRLKRLEIFGFKSFLEKTDIHFKHGITAIVGPNGCGKSNLTDSILWVLGEQRPKNLRGETMEDVIFNGTEHRKPLGVAEVSLTVDDIRDPLPSPYSPYSELTFTRRLFRSGTSEYSINKVPCRLKDIRELLIDLKAGYRAHTIIEQGRIDDLLMASPLQRRELVEEVAGVSKYRLRKEEAVRKLQATEQNLTRIQDILAEVKRQINALDRQAKAAQKYQKLYDELKSYEVYIASVEWHAAKKQEEELGHAEGSLREIFLQKETEAALVDLRISTLELTLTEAEHVVSQYKDQMAEITGKIGRAEGRLERVHAQKKEWDETRTRTQMELDEVNKSDILLAQTVYAQAEEQAKIDQDLFAINEQLIQSKRATEEIQREVTEKIDLLEKERADLFAIASRLTTAHNNLSHFNAQMEAITATRDADVVHLAEADETLASTSGRLAQIQEKWANAEQQWAEKKGLHEQILNQSSQIESRVKVKETQFYQLKETGAKLQSELSSQEGYYRGRLTPVVDQSLSPHGSSEVIADIMDVPADYEKAIEAALGEQLRGILIEDTHSLKQGIQQLQSLKKGRGTLVLLSPVYGQRVGRMNESPLQCDGILGPALSFVSCKQEYKEVVERLLDGVWIVQGIETLFKLLEIPTLGVQPHPRLFVTVEGEIFWPNGVVSAGEVGEGGRFLEQKRAIATLSKETSKVLQEAEQLTIEMNADKKLLVDIGIDKGLIEKTIGELVIQKQELQKETNTLSIQHEKIQVTRQTVLKGIEDGEKNTKLLAQKKETEQGGITALQQLKEERDGQFSGRVHERDALHLRHQELKERHVSHQIIATSLTEKRQHLIEKKNQIDRSLLALKASRDNKTSLLSSLQEKWEKAVQEEQETVLEIGTMASSQGKNLEELRRKTEDHTALSTTFEAARTEGKKAQHDRDNIILDLNEKAVHRLEAKMAYEKIQETLFSQYHLEPATADNPPPLATSGESGLPPMEEIVTVRNGLRESLRDVGPVHLGAIEEHQELTQRHEFMKGQENDMIVSMDDLRSAITKLNQTTRGVFTEAFHALNKKFGEMFASFFGGGHGELLLSDPANPLESGIEIVAAPPGKKPRTLHLLSGGEKALTGLSLLFATFLPSDLNPNPSVSFCILDEVDAALDEENARRFSSALSLLSEVTQFVVVTHNKQTMEKANLLYGITAEDAGISKVVSVNLKEAEAFTP